MRKKGLSYDNKSKSGKASKKHNKITFILISESKFGIVIPYNLMMEEIRNVLKKNMAEWDRDLKLWISTLDNYNCCFKQIRALYQNKEDKHDNEVAVYKIPDFAFKASEEMNQELNVKNIKYSVAKIISYNTIETEIDPRVLSFYYKLYDFQKESLQFGIKKHGRLLLADEMGVGKTIQSLAIISVYRHEWPFLVICPSSLRLNWQQEILNWLGDYITKSQIQVYSKGRTPIRQNAKAIIVSYDLAWKIKDQIDHFKVVIADEAHYLKSFESKRSEVLTPYLSTRRRVILLTGTPALAKPRQIFNLISIIRPDIFFEFKQFAYRYCDPTPNPWSRSMEYNGCQNAKQLHYLIKDRIMMRRLKKDVLTQLPEKQRQKIFVDTDKNVIKEIKQLLSQQNGAEGGNLENMVLDLLCNFSSEDSNSFVDAKSAITKAYSLTGLAKLTSTKQYILQLLQNNIKLIVFAHHQNVLDGLEEGLKEKKYKYVRIDGKVSSQKRHEYVNAFQDDERVMVALLSITAAGVGLTLTAASTVVFAELHWTPGMMAQAQDRAHRIGQKNAVNCHYLIGENTLDDILYRFIQKKINNVTSFVDGKAQKLQIQSLSKGEKGKVTISLSENSNTVPNPKQKNILFKFESIKPMINKYYLKYSQDTEISDSNADAKSNSDVEYEQQIEGKTNSKRQPYQIKEEDMVIRELDSDRKHETPERTQENDDDSTLQRKSSEICKFILESAQQILEYSQKQATDSDYDSEQTN